MPAHVTALYPFLPEHRLTDAVLAQLSELCAGLPILEIVFRRLGRFPDMLYLAPEPAGGLRELTLPIGNDGLRRFRTEEDSTTSSRI